MNPPITKKRGPAKGHGGRPRGPEKVTLQVRVLAGTPARLRALGLNAGAVLDAL